MIKEELYRGMMIKTGCFELVGIHRPVTSLVISEATFSNSTRIDLPVTHFPFQDRQQVLEATPGDNQCMIGMIRARLR